MPIRLHWAILSLLTAVFSLNGWAETVSVAVASNFSAPMQAIAREFEKDTGHTAQLSLGATGKLYAQITHGAPFDVLLAADDTTPEKLEAASLAVQGTRFTYALGALALWSPAPNLIDGQGDILRKGNFKYLAIANPKTAPYGAAAVDTLRRRNLWEKLQAKLVQGENIAQTHQFVATGNAELGFVARAQITRNGELTGGSAWFVPPSEHAPIRQDAVLLARGKNNAGAIALMAYLKGEKARAMIRSFGYNF